MLALGALLLTGLTACGHSIPGHQARIASAQPQALPGEQSRETAARSPVPLSLSNPIESEMPLSLTGDLTPLQRSIITAFPETIDDTRHPLSSDFRWTFKRQGEPQVSLQDGQLRARAEYKGQIEPRSGGGEACQLDPVYPILEWRGNLMPQPAGSPGALAVRTTESQTAVSVGPQSDSKCNMFARPLQEQLQELLQLDRIKESVDKAVDRSGTEFAMRPVWTQLHGPYAIPSPRANSQICLYPEPTEVRFGRLEGTLQRAVLQSSARVFPIAILEQRCRAPRVGPDRISTEQPAREPHFQLETQVPIPYDHVARAIEESLFRTPIPLEKGLLGEKTAVVDRIKAEHAAGKVLITLQTNGDLQGPLYYWGTPRLEGRYLTIPDLQMDLETRKVLEERKSGLSKKLDGALREKLIRAARIDLSDDVTATKRALSGPHKGDAFLLDLELTQGKPERVYATPQGLVTFINFEGRARMEGNLPVTARSTPSRTPMPSSTSTGQDTNVGGTFTGQVSQVDGKHFILRQPSGTEIRLNVDRDTQVEVPPKLGDQIVVELTRDGRVRSIRPTER
jgi:Domain of unknown function (DUF4403)